MAKIVADILFDEEETETTIKVQRFLANFKDNIPSVIKNLENTLRYLRKSITVRRMDLKKKEDIGTSVGEGRPAWNLYIYPPTKNHEAMRTWRQIVKKTVFVTGLNDSGRSKKTFMCTTCRSTDHPGGMCPYTSKTDWVAPTPTHSQVLEDLLNPTPRGNSCGSGARGRGARGSGRSRGNAGRGRGNAR